MNCTDFLAKLTDYFDGTIAGDLLTEVRKHLSECHHCEVVVSTTRKTIDVYKDHEVYDFPPDLSTRLRKAIMQRCCESGKTPCGDPIAADDPRLAELDKKSEPIS